MLSVPNLYTNYYYTNSDEDYSTSTQIKLITTSTEDFLYNYDAVGNITQMYKDMVLTESYTYDGLNQLKTATVNGKTYAYTYDGGGNILTEAKEGQKTFFDLVAGGYGGGASCRRAGGGRGSEFCTFVQFHPTEAGAGFSLQSWQMLRQRGSVW